MGYELGKRSARNLDECHHDMQRLIVAAIAISPIDFGVICGGRDLGEQTSLVAQKKSRTMKSKHLPVLYDELEAKCKSGAVDLVAIDPVTGKYSYEESLYYRLHEVIKKVAADLGIEIRWGGDWDRDGDTTDQTFNDLCHWELWAGMYNYDFTRLGIS